MPKKESTSKGQVLPKIFDRDPALKKRVEEYLAKIPQEQKEADLKKFEKFISGEMTWAEIKNYPKTLLKELARIAYTKYQTGDLKVAESLFKGLSVIDHTNWYYRAVLGSIYQKQKMYDQAIGEYNMALLLNEKEIASLTNRGECHMHLENYKQAMHDFEAVVKLDSEEKNPWGKRARVLIKRLVDDGLSEFLA